MMNEGPNYQPGINCPAKYLAPSLQVPLLKSFTALVAAIVLAGILSGCDDSKSSADRAWPPLIGEKYELGNGVNNVACADDLNSIDAAIEAASKNDNDGWKQALAEHSVPVSPGDHILVLNYDIFKGILDVRLRSGPNEGERAYCLAGEKNNGLIAKHL